MKNRTLAVPILAIVSLLFATPALAAPKTVNVEVRVDSQAPNYEGYRAMDGNPDTMWHTEFGLVEPKHPHEMVIDLGAPYKITGIGYLPRPGGGNGTFRNYQCYVSDNPKQFGEPVAGGEMTVKDAETVVGFPANVKGRYVRLRALSEVAGRPWASVAELRILSPGVVFRAKSSSTFGWLNPDGTPKSETEIEFASLKYDLGKREYFAKIAPETYHPQSLVEADDRDPVDVVLRRTEALLEDLKRMPAAPDLGAQEKKLDELKKVAAAVAVEDVDARAKLFEDVCRVRREIAFSNPLLDFDEILFITRHRPGFNHMCDQYYGINAKPGGGVYVLSGAFGPSPKVRDVLADSTVPDGRLAGQKLETGSFVAPDLSFDAQRIAFAYVECQGDTAHRFHTDPARGHWDEGRSYHLFKVNVDGSGLEQLTDGTWNDFDPCWLPNGRIAFITERRGGYLRCGRVCPTYTLFDMYADGGDIRCLSFHETNEWHPSVTQHGRIIYTRWDYVDRHGCTAHLPWITTLDGRDSRAVHGNFAPRQVRPDMELDVRAIPGSHKLVATAAPHHGQAFGSLVLVDPHVEDDDAMAPVKRITPDVGFPETQGGAQVYGTAWPLSETYHLCVYDATMRPGVGFQGGGYMRGNYGIYLVDAFGNKELVYRDPDVACQSPIPLRPRPMPSVTPTLADQQLTRDTTVPPSAGAPEPPEGTLAVIDVYDGFKAWPDDTNIQSLRVIQILPMSVPSGAPPHEVGLRLPTAKDSVMLARYVLGTVPVEPDGSVHFRVPANKEIFFQALDDRGLAVQSMRSATYLQAGERMVCQGCHDRRHRSPRIPVEVPLALRRAPSRLKPDAKGSNPFSYPRLVQPVLDRHCTECHRKEPKTAPSLDREPIAKKWFASYNSLAPDFGFHAYGHGHRTTPGEFGARASKLLTILDEGHYDVKLPQEDFHRLTLWLDLCSIFYGVYEKEGGEAQLRGELVGPTLE